MRSDQRNSDSESSTDTGGRSESNAAKEPLNRTVADCKPGALLAARKRPAHLLTEGKTFLTHCHSLPSLKDPPAVGDMERWKEEFSRDETD